MDISFKNTRKNDENRVGWSCQKPNGVLHKTTRRVNSLNDSIIARRVRDSISPGDYTSTYPGFYSTRTFIR